MQLDPHSHIGYCEQVEWSEDGATEEEPSWKTRSMLFSLPTISIRTVKGDYELTEFNWEEQGDYREIDGRRKGDQLKKFAAAIRVVERRERDWMVAAIRVREK